MISRTIALTLGGGLLLGSVLTPTTAVALPGKCAGVMGVAHRGDRTVHTENTVPAFFDASDRGADAVETDVRITADGLFMLMHDATIDRTTIGTGLIAELPSTYVKSMATNDGGRVPFLRGALSSFRKRTGRMFIEMKRDDPHWTLIKAAEFVSVIRDTAMNTRVTVTGGRRVLSLINQVAPRIRTAWKDPGFVTPEHVARHADGATVGYGRATTAAQVTAMQEAGLQVYMTNGDKDTVRWTAALQRGYDGIYTNEISRLVAWCRAA
jgi:glycerophosphoryl diester phosphodiesterase